MGFRSARVVSALAAVSLLAAASANATKSPGRVAVDGGRLEFEVRDPEGRPLVARVRVMPSALSRLRSGHLRDLYALTNAGNAGLELAAGRYRWVVSHGPEWSLALGSADVVPGRTLRRRITLAHEVTLPAYRGADLHVHTRRSRDAQVHGGVSGKALLAEGVEIAVSTDHNAIGRIESDVASLAGAEVTTWRPEIGHFNAFPLQRVPRWRGTTPERLFAELAAERGVFVQINHPRLDDHIAYFTLGEFDGVQFKRAGFNLNVDGVEVWNGYDLASLGSVDKLLRDWRRLCARGHLLTATGGSDSHGAAGHHPGYPRTYVETRSADGLTDALKAGRAFVTNGPLLELRVHGSGPGDTAKLDAASELVADLRVLAASWLRVDTLELWADEHVVWTHAIPQPPKPGPLDFVVQARVPIGAARTVHAVARGGAGLEALLGRGGVTPLAFTNMVLLDQHEAPRCTPQRRHGGRESLSVLIPEHGDQGCERKHAAKRGGCVDHAERGTTPVQSARDWRPVEHHQMYDVCQQ